MPFKKLFLKNILISGGYNYLTQLINFGASFIIARLLLPADFGLVGLITVFSGFISVFSDSGISMAIIRSSYRETYYRGLSTISLATGILLCVITLCLVYPISVFYENKAIILPGLSISFLFILRALNIVPIAVLQKKMQFGLAGKAQFFGSVVATLSTIIMAYAGWKYWALIWSQYIAAIISFLFLFRSGNVSSLSMRTAVLVKSYSLAATLIGNLIGFNFINYWARNADNLIVGKFYGTSDLGIYSRAYLMLLLPLNLVSGLFSSVLYPSLVKHKNEGGNVEHEYYFILKLISLINLPIGIILIWFPQQFVQLLWGNNWIAVAKLLPYFGLLAMLQTLSSTLGSILVLENKEKVLMFTGWVGGLIMIGAIAIGSTISLTGIAAIYALAYIVIILPFNLLYVFKRHLKFTTGSVQFWLPKVFLALLLWIAIYFSLYKILLLVMGLWVAVAFWEAKFELKKLSEIVSARYRAGRQKFNQ